MPEITFDLIYLLYAAGGIIFIVVIYAIALKFWGWFLLQKEIRRKAGEEQKEKIIREQMKEMKRKPRKTVDMDVISPSDDREKPANISINRPWIIRLVNIIKDRFMPHKVMMINMELANGMHRQFLMSVKPDNTFRYRGKKYIADSECKYYVIDAKLWALDFHENFSLPVRRKIPVKNIRSTVFSSGISEVEYATNPSTLEQFTVAKIAEGIMKGAQIDELFKRIQLMVIITMIAAVIHLLLFVQASGMLDNLNLPF